MDHFSYRKGILYAEDVSIPEIVKEIDTPFYCYSTATLTRHYKVFAEAFSSVPTLICFAVKANSNIAVLKTLAKLGSGADTVSEGEIMRALAAGISPRKIVFSGVGKTRDELRYALKQDIGQFNVESREELLMLSEEACKLGKKANIAVRVNPDVDAGTHDKISTGKKEHKFGVSWEETPDVYEKAKELEGINVVAVATHIGSQITDLSPFRLAFDKIAGLVEMLRQKGHDIKRLDLGGGLGIPYNEKIPPAPAEYGELITEIVKPLGCELVLEPGRLIAGNAGILVTKVVLVKRTRHRNFLVVDAAMNDLLRPSLYNAYHEIITVVEPKKGGATELFDVVGPVCETGDVFGKDRIMPHMQEGDLAVIRSAGAYGAVMAGTYNSRLLVPEIMVNGEKFSVVRPRQTYDDMIGLDKLPDWL